VLIPCRFKVRLVLALLLLLAALLLLPTAAAAATPAATVAPAADPVALPGAGLRKELQQQPQRVEPRLAGVHVQRQGHRPQR